VKSPKHRSQRGQGDVKTMVTTQTSPPPAPITPKTNKKLTLLDIDPLELARQLTIVESSLYQKIKPIECLTRSREQRSENLDNISNSIQTSNRVCSLFFLCSNGYVDCLSRSLRLLTGSQTIFSAKKSHADELKSSNILL
jgi:hypothetical protein